MKPPRISLVSTLATGLVSTLLFLLPSNWFLKGWEDTAFVRGLFVDYLLPKIYATDLVLLALMGLAGWELYSTGLPSVSRSWQKRLGLWIFGLLVFVAGQLWVSPQPGTVWFLCKLALILGGGGALTYLWPKLNQRLIVTSIAVTIFFQASLAFYQTWTQHSLMGYWLLGEPTLPNALGLAASVTAGVIQILPYGTTAHPNVLGGVLAVLMLMVLSYVVKQWPQPRMFKRQPLALISLIGAVVIGGIALFFTHSLSALLVLGVGLFVVGWRLIRPEFGHQPVQRLLLVVGVLGGLFIAPAVIFGLRNPYADITSISRRAFLNQAALSMILTHPMTGVGSNAFTVHLEEYAVTPEVVRFIQPAHHVGLLWLAETGIIGAALLVYTGWLWLQWVGAKTKAHQHQITTNFWWAVLVLTPALAFDHYVLTLNTGLLAAVVWLVSQTQVRE